MKSPAMTFFGMLVSVSIWALHNAPERQSQPDNGREEMAAPITEAPRSDSPAGTRAAFYEAIELARESRAALQDVEDYTAVFTKTERVRHRIISHVLDLKFRREPFSVYVHRRSKGKRSREVIYVAGANDGRMLVHEIGLKFFHGTLRLDPGDPKVMLESRHPITEVGIARLTDAAFSIWETEIREAAPADIDVRIVPSVMLGPTECDVVQVTHLRKQPVLDFQIYRVYFDRRTKVAIQEEQFGWPERPDDEPPLLERYHYGEITTNVGLTDADFDPGNPEYHFVDSRLSDASGPSQSPKGSGSGFSP